MVFFLENPYHEIYLRELAKKLKLSPYAVKKYADLLVKKHLINDEKRANLRYFKANANNLFFKHLKIAFSMDLIVESGLVELLKEELTSVSSIVLFGSVAKGEDDRKSDIDIVIIGKGDCNSLGQIEKKISKEINLHIFSWGEWNKRFKGDMAFYYEIINSGIPLYGELPVIK